MSLEHFLDNLPVSPYVQLVCLHASADAAWHFVFSHRLVLFVLIVIYLLPSPQKPQLFLNPHPQCRERWHNHLNPHIKKDTWATAEDVLIIDLHQKIGSKWSEIAKHLPGRTDNSIKNRYRVGGCVFCVSTIVIFALS